VICLDEIWDEHAHAADLSAFRRLIADRHRGEAWISEGNFALATFDLRLRRADLIVWLQAPTLVCMWRAATRVLRLGEPHKPRDVWRVWRFILGFKRKNAPLIEAMRLKHGQDVPVVRVNTKREVAALMEQLSLVAARADIPSE
jgi:hypothetical protein